MSHLEILEQYRDLKITKDKIESLISNEICDNAVTVSSDHLIRLLTVYKHGKINLNKLIEWVNVVWFSDWFDYNDEQSDSIASVMTELEELDEEGKNKDLTLEKIEKYINALKNNLDISVFS